MAKANEIASKFLGQVLAQEKQRITRLLDSLAEADAAQDDPTVAVGMSAEYVLDMIGMSCVLGDVRGMISSKQWNWIRNVANQEHLRASHRDCIVSYEGREVGFWSYSWPTEPQTTMLYTLDPAIVQAYMGIPADVLARVTAHCLADSDGRPANRWMMRQVEVGA